MNVLFLGYWDLQDPLTAATIFPHLRLLHAIPEVKKLVFSNVQRLPLTGKTMEALSSTGALYRPLHPGNLPFDYLNKVRDFVDFPEKLVQLIESSKIDRIIARGTPAGALAYLAWKKRKVPFIVESLEPHADYMAESKVWSRYDPRYIFQKRWEKKIQRYAAGLMPVTENYRTALIADNVDPERIRTAPCAVHIPDYSFDRGLRETVRRALHIGPDCITGIYVGKFGGIYYNEEAFRIFSAAAGVFPNFRLIILTSHPSKQVGENLQANAFPPEQAFIAHVHPLEVRRYLSAADFAFSTIKPALSRKYCSPVKNGEYWASGLPILLTEGVGDDSDIIKMEGGGATFNAESPDSLHYALLKIKSQISSNHYREDIARLAGKHRSFKGVKEAYDFFLNRTRTGPPRVP